MSALLKKMIAKKIIIAPPFSTMSWAQFLETKWKIPFTEVDTMMQNWALVQSDAFSEKDWQEVQFKKLKKILCQAGKNVPYWRALFKKIGFFPEKIRHIEEIRKIPIITRAELKMIQSEDLLAKNIPASRLVLAATSGSTGEPFQFFQDRRDLFRRCINTTQELRTIGVRSTDAIFRIGLQTHKDLDGLGPRIEPHELESEQKRYDVVYPLIRSLLPRLLISTPSYLERFLFHCEKDGFRPKIDRICYMGEEMRPETKNSLERYFRAKVSLTYGTRECSLIGIQCERQSLHIAPWMNFVEIVDGQIVVTTFENEATVFIRYAIGDGGRLLETPCSCGRSSRTIAFSGRTAYGTADLSDGSVYQMSYVIQYLAGDGPVGIKKFQFEQTTHQRLNMRYVPMDENDCERIESDLQKYFFSIFQDKLEVVFQRVESILPNESGKTSLFIKKIPKQHEGE